MGLLLVFLLTIALFTLGLDFIHMIYHLINDPDLWHVEGVGLKLLVKIIFFLIPIGLLIKRKIWQRLIISIIFCFFFLQPQVWADNRDRCRNAREMFKTGGVARDAKENWLGKIKIDPPKGSFPSDMDKMTWWGEFNPFEFWGSPEFKASWINPQGQEIATQTFKGEKCNLAKNTLRAESQPRGEFEGGMWKVIVTCEDYLIDKQDFAVLPQGGMQQGTDQPGQGQEQEVMIWAADKVKD